MQDLWRVYSSLHPVCTETWGRLSGPVAGTSQDSPLQSPPPPLPPRANCCSVGRQWESCRNGALPNSLNARPYRESPPQPQEVHKGPGYLYPPKSRGGLEYAPPLLQDLTLLHLDEELWSLGSTPGSLGPNSLSTFLCAPAAHR